MKHLNLTNSKPCAERRDIFTPVSKLAAFVILLAVSNQTFSQTASLRGVDVPLDGRTYVAYSHLVSGIVKDEKGDPMVGASIYLKGTTEGTTTNADGQFTFPRKLDEGDRLTISYIGYESVDYVVQGTVDENIVVIMNVDVIVWGDLAVDEVYTTKPGLRRFFKKLF
jgi:hypothetical protein